MTQAYYTIKEPRRVDFPCVFNLTKALYAGSSIKSTVFSQQTFPVLMPFSPPDQSGLRGNQPPVLRKKPGSGSAGAHVPAQPELCGAAAPQAGPKGTPCAPAPVYISKSRKQRACFPFSSVHFSKKARKQITLIVLPLYRQETTALSLPENRPCGSTAYPSLRTYICGSSLAVICFFIPVLLSSCIYRGRVFFCLQFREIWVQSN